MSVQRVDQQLILEIDKILQRSTPNTFIKRGNAFAILEIKDPQDIAINMQSVNFDGLSIDKSFLKQDTLHLEGECYISEKEFNDEEYELYIEIHNYSQGISLENSPIQNYTINTATKSIELSLNFAL
jgi:hypothetical protein